MSTYLANEEIVQLRRALKREKIFTRKTRDETPQMSDLVHGPDARIRTILRYCVTPGFSL